MYSIYHIEIVQEECKLTISPFNKYIVLANGALGVGDDLLRKWIERKVAPDDKDKKMSKILKNFLYFYLLVHVSIKILIFTI